MFALFVVFLTILFFLLDAQPGDLSQQYIGNPDIPPDIPPLGIRLFAFLAITLPGFFGFRPPWSPQIIWPALALPVFMFYLAGNRLYTLENHFPDFIPR